MRVKIQGFDIRRASRAIAFAEQALRPDKTGAALAKHNAAFAVAICVHHKRIAETYGAEELANVEATADRFIAALDEAALAQKEAAGG